MKAIKQKLPFINRSKLFLLWCKAPTLLFLFIATFASAQSRLVQGVITDSDGEPLIGATILEVGTDNGTSTGFDGDFSITVSGDDATLEVSYIGFVSKTVPVGTASNLAIIMDQSSQSLDEVVVIAYGTNKKSNLTSAVTSVDTKILKNRPVRTIPEMLEGSVAGLNIDLNSGAPDAVADLNIRGFTGLNKSQGPLVMVDGVEQDINSINPNDVASITVLKDAAASAIYGSRAPFGVIIITTKNGNKDTPLRIDYSVSTQFNSPLRLPHTQNSLDFVQDMNRAFYNSGQTAGFYPDVTIENIKKFNAGQIPNNSRIGDRTGDGNLNWEAHVYAHGNTDYVGEAFKDNAMNWNQNLSISGGSDRFTYYLSLGNNTKEGIYNTNLDHWKRNNAALNVEADVTEWLDVRTRIRYSKSKTLRPNYRGANQSTGSDDNIWNQVSYFPNVPIKNPDGNYHWLSAFPVFDGLQGTINRDDEDIWLIPSVEIKPFENFRIRGQYAYNSNSEEDLLTTKVVYVDPGTGIPRRSARSATYDDVSRNNGRRNYYQWDVNGEYATSFGSHNLLALAGVQQEFNRYNQIITNRRDLYSTDFPVLGNAYGESFVLNERLYEWATMGYYFRASYNYEEKYLLDFNGRYDGSSRFRPESRWSFLPSVSAGYNIAKENFWPFKDVINRFKITGSWGKLGNQLLDVNGNGSTNDLIDLYTYLPVFKTVPKTTSILGGAQPPYVVAPGLTRDDLTWEKPESIGFGVDMGLLDDRLAFEYQWYQRTTYDALGIAEQLPLVLGATVPRANNATTETRGWELSAGWEDYIMKNTSNRFLYGIRAALSDYIGYVVSYGPGNESGTRSGTWTRGEVFGTIYGYEFDKIAQNIGDITSGIPATNNYYYPGDVLYKDTNGDGIINGGTEGAWYSLGDQELLGYNYPRYRYSLNMYGGWKDLNFSFFFSGVGKQHAWANNARVFGHATTQSWSSRTAYDLHQDLGYWRPDNTDAFLPRIYQDGKNTNLPNDHYLMDLSHLMVKNINVSYSLPNRILENLRVQNMSFTFSGENLGFIYNRSWLKLDPTLLSRGVSGYPLLRTYSVGLNVGF